MTLTISSHDLPDAGVRLALTGEIDLANAKTLREAIHQAAGNRAVRAVIVDLDDVTFIDSTGIATLIDGRKLADVCATSFRVANPRDLVLRVLEITGVLTYLTSEASGDELTGSAAGPSARR
jgi:anti-sigma B factor antagonist